MKWNLLEIGHYIWALNATEIDTHQFVSRKVWDFTEIKIYRQPFPEPSQNSPFESKANPLSPSPPSPVPPLSSADLYKVIKLRLLSLPSIPTYVSPVPLLPSSQHTHLGNYSWTSMRTQMVSNSIIICSLLSKQERCRRLLQPLGRRQRFLASSAASWGKGVCSNQAPAPGTKGTAAPRPYVHIGCSPCLSIWRLFNLEASWALRWIVQVADLPGSVTVCSPPGLWLCSHLLQNRWERSDKPTPPFCFSWEL